MKLKQNLRLQNRTSLFINIQSIYDAQERFFLLHKLPAAGVFIVFYVKHQCFESCVNNLVQNQKVKK